MKFINSIISFSLRNELLVILGALLLIVGGIQTSRNMDIDVFPDLTAPTVAILTEAGGMAPEEVERLVTFPIETAVNGATDVRRVRSTSMYGFSFVWAEFNWGTDIYKARQIINEKLVTLSEALPQSVTPVLAPQSSVMGEILFIGMQADSTSMMDLRTMAEWTVKPAILATGGVSQVTIIGGDYKQYHVLADPLKMEALGVTMQELENAATTMSDNSVGGVLRDYGNEYAVRGIARTTDLDELGETLVKTSPAGRPITIADVAEVKIGSAVKMGHASLNASPAIILSVSKQPNINTLDVTEKIEANLESIAKSLPADVKLDTHIFRSADFIETSVNNVGNALIEGAIFVIIVLFFFLNNLRTTLISIIAIPLSLLGTVIVLHLFGMNINTMTLGGMCIAIGSLVDDAIIDVENVYKRLRENHLLPPDQRRSKFTVVFEASKEIRASILNATFIIIVAFIPLFFLSGLEGRMLKPLGIAYIISLFMSLIVAMTVTPLLSKLLLSGERHLERNKKESAVTRWLSNAYGSSLRWALSHRKAIIAAVGVIFGVTLSICFTLGQSFLPEFNEGSATIAAITKPGVSLNVNNQIGNLIEQELLKIPEVTATARRSGRGELDEHSQATNSAEIDVQFTLSDRSRDEVFDDMRHHLAAIPGIAATIGQPIGHRIDHMVSGTRANIAVKLFGPDLSTLYLTGNRIKDAVSPIEGLVDVSVEQLTETPQIQIKANRNALARHGISVEDFNRFVNLAFSGQKIADIYEGQQSFDIVLRLNRDYTETLDGLRHALIDTPDGGKVPLESVARIECVGGPSAISRENVQRKLVVSANVSGRDINSVVNEIKETISREIKLDEGYRIEYGGQFESAQKATRTLIIASLISILVIFLLLYGEFKKVRLALIILISLPFALIGGVLAIFITSGVVSTPSIIGFITLFGVATRNGILLVSRYNHLRDEGLSIDEAVAHGSVDRLNPILMTALTSALALIPLLIAADKPGNEIQSPMAVVVLGGLLTSTLLNIYLIPIIYRWHAHRVEKSGESKSSD